MFEMSCRYFNQDFQEDFVIEEPVQMLVDTNIHLVWQLTNVWEINVDFKKSWTENVLDLDIQLGLSARPIDWASSCLNAY